MILKSFFSYAVYAVNRDAACPAGAAEGAGGGDCVGDGEYDVFENSDDIGLGAGADESEVEDAGAAVGAVEVDPKRPRISSIVDLGCCDWDAGCEEVVVGAEEPNISARRSWLDWADAAGCPFVVGVEP